jgi:hypothetical protein
MAPTQQQIFARRRGLAILVFLIIIGVLWSVMSSGSNQQAGPTPIPTSDSITASANAGEVPDCAAGVVTVAAKIGDASGPKGSFTSDEKPMIWYSITNNGMEECNFNAGSRVTFYTITSGGETYWSSKDCDRSADTDAKVRLAANQTIDAPKGIWERVRSGTEGCGAEQESVPAGGASYFLKVEVNGVYSEEEVQFLLN